jgi:hypothetical protein
MREFKTKEMQEVSETERQIQAELQETSRLVFVHRESAGDDDFLEKLLDGRPMEPESVKKLALFTMLHFEEPNAQRSSAVRESILRTCREFLGDEEFKKIKLPKRRYGILDEMADEHFQRTGERDEFLEGLRHTT